MGIEKRRSWDRLPIWICSISMNDIIYPRWYILPLEQWLGASARTSLYHCHHQCKQFHIDDEFKINILGIHSKMHPHASISTVIGLILIRNDDILIPNYRIFGHRLLGHCMMVGWIGAWHLVEVVPGRGKSLNDKLIRHLHIIYQGNCVITVFLKENNQGQPT